MEDTGSIIFIVFLLALAFGSLAVAMYHDSVSDYRLQELKAFKLEAYERGHMVRCLGVTGYHWECE